MPPAVTRNSETIIVCHYDLEDDSLYTVKWYRGGREFFRYTPMEDPPIKIFPIHGLHLDRNKSNASQVVLRHVTPAISGRYSCEVSADAPSFHTALVSGDMDVVDPPKAPPAIRGIKARYRVGEILNGNCSSQPSRPPANLTWVINDQVADPGYVIHYPHTPVAGKEKWETEEMRRMASKAGLRFVVHSEHFVESASGGGRKLKIRCTASVHGLYWKTNEKSVEEERAKLYGGSPQAVEIGEESIRPGVPYYLGGGRGHYDGVVVKDDDSMEMERRGNDVIVEDGGGNRRDMEALDEAGREDGGYHGGGRRRHGSNDASSGSIGPPLTTSFLALISLFVSIR